MAQKKLTLRLEGELISRAKRIARVRGTSVSGMVAGFFESIEDRRPAERGHGEITRRLKGSIKPSNGSSADEGDYLHHLERKHG